MERETDKQTMPWNFETRQKEGKMMPNCLYPVYFILINTDFGV